MYPAKSNNLQIVVSYPREVQLSYTSHVAVDARSIRWDFNTGAAQRQTGNGRQEAPDKILVRMHATAHHSSSLPALSPQNKPVHKN